jgi:hypothetical protein
MGGMRGTSAVALTLGAAAVAASPPVPRALAALAAKARIEAPIVRWCAGGLVAGAGNGYAIAVGAGARGGRYLVLQPDATVFELAAFAGGADLSCYSPARARALDATIRRSDTIHGRIEPRWRTTVVCGFVEATHAVCWQYSRADRAFVQVGEWTT